MLPLFIANSTAGALLFNVYGATLDRIPRLMNISHSHVPFLAGFCGGISHSLLSIPLENAFKTVSWYDLSKALNQNVVAAAVRAMKRVHPGSSGHLIQLLYKNGSYCFARDAVGFMAFFGVYEMIRHHASAKLLLPAQTNSFNQEISAAIRMYHPADDLGDSESLRCRGENAPKLSVYKKQGINTILILTAGCLAGMAYQTVAHPIERLRVMLHDGGHGDERVHHISNLRRIIAKVGSEGPRILFRGLGGQLVRTMPPSALGLVVYELSNSRVGSDV